MDTGKQRLNILVVDDEPRITRALGRLLKPLYEVFQADSGEKALEIIRSRDIHVIVSDQRMPEMTGSELLSKVRLISPNTTRILLTGYSDLSAVIESVNQGEIFRYVTKPWNNEIFLSTVKQAGEIAMSLFETAAAEKTAPVEKPRNGSDRRVKRDILVLDRDNELVQLLEQALKGRVKCFLADSIPAASMIFQERDINFIMMNISLNDKEALAFIKSAKSLRPDILCLVVADSADINHIMSLINEGQIYRFITKPVKFGQLKMYTISALTYRDKLIDQPELLARHALEKIADEEEKGIANNFSHTLDIFRHAIQRLIT